MLVPEVCSADRTVPAVASAILDASPDAVAASVGRRGAVAVSERPLHTASTGP